MARIEQMTDYEKKEKLRLARQKASKWAAKQREHRTSTKRKADSEIENTPPPTLNSPDMLKSQMNPRRTPKKSKFSPASPGSVETVKLRPDSSARKALRNKQILEEARRKARLSMDTTPKVMKPVVKNQPEAVAVPVVKASVVAEEEVMRVPIMNDEKQNAEVLERKEEEAVDFPETDYFIGENLDGEKNYLEGEENDLDGENNALKGDENELQNVSSKDDHEEENLTVDVTNASVSKSSVLVKFLTWCFIVSSFFPIYSKIHPESTNPLVVKSGELMNLAFPSLFNAGASIDYSFLKKYADMIVDQGNEKLDVVGFDADDGVQEYASDEESIEL